MLHKEGLVDRIRSDFRVATSVQKGSAKLICKKPRERKMGITCISCYNLQIILLRHYIERMNNIFTDIYTGNNYITKFTLNIEAISMSKTMLIRNTNYAPPLKDKLTNQ